ALLISHSSALYGAQRSLLDLAIGLRGEGVQVHAAIPDRGPLGELLQKQEIPICRLPCRNWVHSRTAYHWMRKYLLNRRHARVAESWIKHEGYDLLHTNSVVIPIGAMIAERTGIPHIWHVREGMPPRPRFFFWSLPKVKRYVMRTTKFMVGISDHTCAGMTGICPPDRIRRIYNGPVGLEELNGPIPKRPDVQGRTLRLLCVGRSSPAKGHDLAAEAVRSLRSAGVDARLTIAGEVPDAFREQLLAITPEIDMPGFVSDARSLYDEHDILVMASQKEAFGRVTVEAMARGCIVVGSQSGATPEIIHDGENGLLFEPGNSENLAAKVQRLLDQCHRWQDIRDSARQDVRERFTRERYAEDVAGLYREALSS
ncbi:MAG TPA: glycosyltransferase family 4 protein, partial [Fimbriimonadaceae bacterium]|nr:glycosyltransferase family 4 protein [Fimbriimonadaceae bacterium]